MRFTQLVTASLIVIASVAFGQDKNVIAKVGSKILTLDEFNKRYEDIKKQAVNPPTKKAFLEDLVRYELGVQEAEKRQLQKDPVVAERLRQEMYKALIEKDLGDKVNQLTVTDDEMKKYYQENPEIRTSHILIQVKPGANNEERAAARKRAEEILGEVKASKRTFEDLVKLYTDDVSTKKQGGDIGYQTKLTVVPQYYDTADRLKVNQISGLVETPYGFHIIKLTGRHKFEEANKRQIRAAVFERKRATLFNQYFDKLKKNYSITINSEAVK